MNREPDFLEHLRAELSNGRVWLDRAIVLGYAIAAGLAVVGFTVASDWVFTQFSRFYRAWPWAVLLTTPLLTAAIVWCTRRWFPGAAGSGIPQVKAALDPDLPERQRGRFASLRLTLGKIALGAAGFAAGLSIGREGPSVQVAAGVMQHARRWLSRGSAIDGRALLLAGGAAGIAAAFNAPLAGVVFAIEELSGRLESRSSGLIITAIVLAGLVAVSVFGNASYFGVIRAPSLGWDALLPGLLVALLSGAAGGVFARLLIASLTAATTTGGGGRPQRLHRWRAQYPVRFAAAGGLAVAVIGLATGGVTFGAGSEAVSQMLHGHDELTPLYTVLKFIATWLTAWCGVPGGIFAPSLAIGAGIGDAVARLASDPLGPALIALGMAGFLAAVTQAPLTAFIIVMEMVDGHSMVLSLMASAMLASLVSRMISRPLYDTLAAHMVALAIGHGGPGGPGGPRSPGIVDDAAPSLSPTLPMTSATTATPTTPPTATPAAEPANGSATYPQFQAAMLADGYDEVLERHWPADVVVAEHTHDFEANALVVQGEMWLSEGSNAPRHLLPGDRFHLQPGAPHAERYGPQGATYWVGRRAGAPQHGG